MADNVFYTEPGTGTKIATEDLGGAPPVQLQRVKVTWGVDGTGTNVTSASPMPVVAGVDSAVAGSAVVYNSSANNTGQLCKASAGRLLAVHVANKNAVTCFIQFYNPSGSVSVGSNIVMSLAVPPGNGANVYGQLEFEFASPLTFSNKIYYACTTAPDGTGAPASPLVVNLIYV